MYSVLMTDHPHSSNLAWHVRTVKLCPLPPHAGYGNKGHTCQCGNALPANSKFCTGCGASHDLSSSGGKGKGKGKGKGDSGKGKGDSGNFGNFGKGKGKGKGHENQGGYASGMPSACPFPGKDLVVELVWTARNGAGGALA